MEALFFLASAEDAIGVTSSDDLPAEPVADPLPLGDPSPLASLAEILGVDHPVRPLRDATCRSFPVWDLGETVAESIAEIDDAEIDAVAERWLEKNADTLAADPFELATLLNDIRNAVRSGDEGPNLYVLLEERAF